MSSNGGAAWGENDDGGGVWTESVKDGRTDGRINAGKAGLREKNSSKIEAFMGDGDSDMCDLQV